MACADLMCMLLMASILLMAASRGALPMPDGADDATILSLALIAFLFGSAEVIRDNAAHIVFSRLSLKAIWNAPMARCGVPSKSPDNSSDRLSWG